MSPPGFMANTGCRDSAKLWLRSPPRPRMDPPHEVGVLECPLLLPTIYDFAPFAMANITLPCKPPLNDLYDRSGLPCITAGTMPSADSFHGLREAYASQPISLARYIGGECLVLIPW